MFDIAQQHQRIRFCPVNNRMQAFQSAFTPALEMQAMCSQISFYPEMEIGNNQHALFAFDDKCRALPDKFHFHNSLTNPFWGW